MSAIATTATTTTTTLQSKEMSNSDYILNKLIPNEASAETDQNNNSVTPYMNSTADEYDGLNKRKSTDSEVELIDEYTHLSKKHQQLKKYKRQNSQLIESNNKKQTLVDTPNQHQIQESQSSQLDTDEASPSPAVELPIVSKKPGQGEYSKKEETPKVRKMKSLPEHATAIMRQWFEDHIDHPYPTEQDRIELARKGQLAENQVKAWFANRRNRSFQKGKYSSVGKSRRCRYISTKLDTVTPTSPNSQRNVEARSDRTTVERLECPNGVAAKEISTLAKENNAEPSGCEVQEKPPLKLLKLASDPLAGADQRKSADKNKQTNVSMQQETQRLLCKPKKLPPIQPRPNAQQQQQQIKNMSFLPENSPHLQQLHQQQQPFLRIQNNFSNFPTSHLTKSSQQLNEENLLMSQISHQTQSFKQPQQHQEQTPTQQNLQQKISQQKQHLHLQLHQFHQQMQQHHHHQQHHHQPQNNSKISWEQQQPQHQQHYYNSCCHQKSQHQHQHPQQPYPVNFRTFNDLNNYFNPIVSPSIIQQSHQQQQPHQPPTADQMLPFGNIPTPVSAHSASSLTSTFNFNEPIVHNYQIKDQIPPIQSCYSTNPPINHSQYQKHLIHQHQHHQQLMENNCCYILGGPPPSNQHANLGYLNYPNFQDYNFLPDPTAMMQLPNGNSGQVNPNNPTIAAPIPIPVNMSSNQYQCDTPPPIITKNNKIAEENTNNSSKPLMPTADSTIMSQQQQAWCSVENNNSPASLLDTANPRNTLNLSISTNNTSSTSQPINSDQRNSYYPSSFNKKIIDKQQQASSLTQIINKNSNELANVSSAIIDPKLEVAKKNQSDAVEQSKSLEHVSNLNIVNIHPKCLENVNISINTKELKTKPKDLDLNNNNLVLNPSSSMYYMNGSQPMYPAYYPYQATTNYSYNPENVQSFQSMANNFSEIITRNSAFQQYVAASSAGKNLNEADVESREEQQLQQHDAARFTDAKNREWCVSHHPRLSSTLLNMGVPSRQQFNN